MKVLLINDNGIEVGGAETYLVNLKKGLIALGHDVKILTSKPFTTSEPVFSDYTFMGVNPQSPLRLFPYVFNINALQKLREVLAEFQPDIVHLHFIFYHTSPSILLALQNIPTLMTLHAHEILAPVGINYTSKCNHPFIGYCIQCTGILKFFPEKIKRSIFKKLSKNIKYYIAPSKYYEQMYKKAGYKNVIQMYNGIIEDEKYTLVDSTKKNLLYIGRLAPEKGVDVIVRSLPKILEKHPKIKLTIVGDGPEKENLKTLIKKLEMTEYVQMVGKISNDKTKTFYKDSTIVIVPSTYPDNLPTVCIEAMNNGRTIIASKIGGLPELVIHGKNGFLIKPGDHEELAKYVIELFSDTKKLEAFSKESHSRMQLFNMHMHLKQLVALYANIKK